jgi:equilibrative nucleoside transporter 1/2/3
MRRPTPEESTFELQHLSDDMGLFRSRQKYQPVGGDIDADTERDDESARDESETDTVGEAPFSWVEYVIFLLLGIAMLWAW